MSTVCMLVIASAQREIVRRLRVLPDPARGVHDQLQLAPLILLAQQDAVLRRREPALRADRKVLERYVAARLPNAAKQVLPRPERPPRAADPAQHHPPLARHQAPR